MDLVLCKVLKPHGLDGAVKVAPIFVDFDYKELKNIYFYDKSQRKSKLIKEYVKNLNGFYIIKFKEINSIEQAETLRNKKLLIDRSEYEVFNNKLVIEDLIGVEVFDDTNAESVGFVTKVEDYGASPIITLSMGGMSYMVPFLDEIFKYDKANNKLLINYKRYLEVRVWDLTF